MALTQTTLLVAGSATTLRFRVTSATGAVVGGFMKVDFELMVIVAINGLDIDVRSRGDRGGVAQAHDILAPVVFGLWSDQPNLPAGENVYPPYEDMDSVNVGQNGTLVPPLRNTTYVLNKGSALSATTLGAPTKAQDGILITLFCASAFAHVVTATGLIDDGVTGGAKTTLTFGAFVGASITLQAYNGHWIVIAKNVCVIT